MIERKCLNIKYPWTCWFQLQSISIGLYWLIINQCLVILCVQLIIVEILNKKLDFSGNIQSISFDLSYGFSFYIAVIDNAFMIEIKMIHLRYFDIIRYGKDEYVFMSYSNFRNLKQINISSWSQKLQESVEILNGCRLHVSIISYCISVYNVISSMLAHFLIGYNFNKGKV
jgi:hypothetical protein